MEYSGGNNVIISYSSGIKQFGDGNLEPPKCPSESPGRPVGLAKTTT